MDEIVGALVDQQAELTPLVAGRDDAEPVTVVRGSAAALCAVAGQRAEAAETDLRAEGPDGEAVLALVRTFA